MEGKEAIMTAGKQLKEFKHIMIVNALVDLRRAVEDVETLWMEVTKMDENPPSELATVKEAEPSLASVLDSTPSTIEHYCSRLREAMENIRRELFHGS